MKLVHKVKEVYLVDYNDWDDFINESLKDLGFTPKVEFEIVAQEELSNYISVECEVENVEPDKYDLMQLEEYLSGKSHRISNSTIANYLCSKGLLKPGHYVINVFW